MKLCNDTGYKNVTRITTTGVGQVANLPGLTPVKESSKIKNLTGNYLKYDSLTVSGPLNSDGTPPGGWGTAQSNQVNWNDWQQQ